MYIMGFVVFLSFMFFFGTRCSIDGCYNSKVRGNFCIQHICCISDCTNARAYNDRYCYTHKSMLEDEEGVNGKYGSYNLRISNTSVSSNSSYTTVSGSIKNTSYNTTYYYVKVKGAFQDSFGNVVDTDWTYAVGSEGLAPGESTKFKMSVKKNYKIDDCEVTVLNIGKLCLKQMKKN